MGLWESLWNSTKDVAKWSTKEDPSVYNEKTKAYEGGNMSPLMALGSGMRDIGNQIDGKDSNYLMEAYKAYQDTSKNAAQTAVERLKALGTTELEATTGALAGENAFSKRWGKAKTEKQKTSLFGEMKKNPELMKAYAALKMTTGTPQTFDEFLLSQTDSWGKATAGGFGGVQPPSFDFSDPMAVAQMIKSYPSNVMGELKGAGQYVSQLGQGLGMPDIGSGIKNLYNQAVSGVRGMVGASPMKAPVDRVPAAFTDFLSKKYGNVKY
jgi:hypothetical protein